MPGWRSQGRLILLNSLTCGLEICVAAGITYVPPLLLEAGVEERYMTMVLGIGPVLGLLFIPLIGSASDQCNSSYGRRRPFIWLLSLGVLLALFIIPKADLLAARLYRGERTLQVGFLILGVGLLDFCGQVCFTPLEALLSDLYREEEDCSQAFAMFSFMVSVGGCVGYLLPAVDWSRSLLSVYLGGQAECLFSLLILIFVTSVIITMKVSEETSCASSSPTGSGSFLESSAGTMEAGCCGPPRSCFYLLRCKLRLLKAGPLLCLLRTCWTMTPAIFWSYCHIPQVMRQLCMAQLCSWMAVMSFMLFYTDFVGEGLYDGVPSALPGTMSRQRYDEGIRIGSLGLFLQCATSTFFSLVMSRLVRRFGSRWVYLSSMVSFTVSALVICLSKSVVLVTTMAALTGFAYATLQTLPYTLTCHYHKEKEVYMPKGITKSMHTNGMTYLSPAQEEEGVQNHKTAPYKHPLLSQDGLFQPSLWGPLFSLLSLSPPTSPARPSLELLPSTLLRTSSSTKKTSEAKTLLLKMKSSIIFHSGCSDRT
ncbi:solute carrier family 45 member 3 isoform X2 [Girardinichthys multiradiatus]|uniref:solute carrier family 45 member 3 isoform X2 n=1 Tax=Girardinichthys multiradiatus TaxID=208333 RepID=UPI001FAB84E8|nr:solute carrier family 45 member 3 isoform X2 [Girardinichthys multiradiatus]